MSGDVPEDPGRPRDLSTGSQIPPRRSRSSRRPRRVWSVVAALSAVAFLIGFGVAWAAISVSPVTNRGVGNYVHGTRLTFWSQAAVWTSSIPSTVPATLSTTLATPTVLPATGQAYGINAGTAGDGAVQWNFSEVAAPPHNTEFEILFTVATGSTPTNTSVTVFLETQAANPGSVQTFVLYFDAGAGAVVFDKATELTEQCNAVGSCP